MKICDRCHEINGSSVMSTEEVVFDRLGEVHDLCESCKEKVREFINNPRKYEKKEGKRGRKGISKLIDKIKTESTGDLQASDRDD